MLANMWHIVRTGTTLVFEPKSDVCVSAANKQKWLGMYL